MSRKNLKAVKGRRATRKQFRKQQRQAKKARKQQFHSGKRSRRTTTAAQQIPNVNNIHKDNVKTWGTHKKCEKSTEELLRLEKQKEDKLKKQMVEQRKHQLVLSNCEEDKTIKRLEKQLKFVVGKNKKRTLPSSFVSDGLDFLLDVCDSNRLNAEQTFDEANDAFEEDFAFMTDEQKTTPTPTPTTIKSSSGNNKRVHFDNADDVLYSENSENSSDSEQHIEEEEETEETPLKSDLPIKDIYGRLRDNQSGEIIQETKDKYIPPALRESKLNANGNNQQQMERVKRQLKGLLNRLTEQNLHSISNDVEKLYMNYSRNEMNTVLTELMLETLVTPVHTPDSLLMEHVVLMVVLHANVNVTEVGAYFLQTIAHRFHREHGEYQANCQDKTIDNLTMIIAQMYNFKLIDCKFVFDVLHRLLTAFTEKDIECIVSTLRQIGFQLRRDDPLALKQLIVKCQQLATDHAAQESTNARTKFLLDILLAIKNNNTSKIPNYDTTHSDHLKKLMKNLIRKGNCVTPLNIGLQDLLDAEEKGRWWIVGSAWSGTLDTSANHNTKETETNFHSAGHSEDLLQLARKQRMNTDIRRAIFCSIISAEDYLDAFGKLLKLGLKNQQEREIIYVILHCCLSESVYNPFYAVLTLKFCEYNRRFQMCVKYSVWDKLKALSAQSVSQITNLSKLLTYLIAEQALSLSVLKVVEFSEMNKVTLRFIRQILVGILLHENSTVIDEIFTKISANPKLKLFRESLRLFIHHFLVKNVEDCDDDSSGGAAKVLSLRNRCETIDTILSKR